MRLLIRAEETKNEQALDYPLPAELVRVLDLYLTRHRRHLVRKGDEGWLFPGQDGGRKHVVSLAMQIKDAIRRHLGLAVNPHLFRHLAAKFLLQASPGNLEAVRQLLGHKSLETTAMYYAQLDTAWATTVYQEQLLERTARGGGVARPVRRGDPARVVLGPEAWPAADRAAWAQATTKGGLLDDAGPAAGWSAVARGKRVISYGRWLGFLARTGRLDPDSGPGERAIPANVAAYLKLLEGDCASVTCWGYVCDLAIMLAVLAPGEERPWLRRIVGRLHARMKPENDRDRRRLPAERIYQEGVSMMAEALAMPSDAERLRPTTDGPLMREVTFRDGLMLATLIAVPLRRRSFTSLEVGRHLVRQSDRFRLRLDARDLKNARSLDAELPRSLVPWLDHYLAGIRPRLLGSGSSPALWISRAATTMSCHSISRRIEKVTRRRFGRPLSMHLFRHCAATSLALDLPEYVQAVPALLGHQSSVSGARYYILAGANQAASTYQQELLALRRRLRRTVG